MNNFDTAEKIESIDKAIESVLKEHDIDWKDKVLYSWNWTDQTEVIPGVVLYNPSGIMIFYNSNDILIQKISSNKKVSDHIYATFIEVRNKSLPKHVENNDFVLNLNIALYTRINKSNFVVSSIPPDKRITEKNDLHPDVGKWYIGF